MRFFPSQKAISWLLTALLLVNGAGMHGFCHAHVEGDEFHSHDNETMLSHDCDSHNRDHSQEKVVGYESQLAEVSIHHIHLSFFGMDFSQPDSEDSPSDDEETQSSIFVRLTHDCSIVLVAQSLDSDCLRILSLSPTSCDVVTFQVATLSAPQVPTAPLCDCARFERSGVLVI